MYYATAKEMEILDNFAVTNGLEIRQMMELAGWHMLSLLRRLNIPKQSSIAIIVGKGNKGGDGLAAARHLINHGWKTSVILLSKTMSKDSLHHLRLLEKMNASVTLYSEYKAEIRNIIENSDILIDALIGYHLDGPPRGVFREMIAVMNDANKKIIAYDLPSGVDATTGKCLDSCIRAYATLSLALPKSAFRTKSAGGIFGKIFIADIGIPAFLYDTISPGSRPPFEKFSGGLAAL